MDPGWDLDAIPEGILLPLGEFTATWCPAHQEQDESGEDEHLKPCNRVPGEPKEKDIEEWHLPVAPPVIVIPAEWPILLIEFLGTLEFAAGVDGPPDRQGIDSDVHGDIPWCTEGQEVV